MLTPGTLLAHYRIIEKIGAGGMGEVYRARDEQLERDIALKVLPASSFADPTARARLLREARSAAALNHPHICTIHEVGEANGQAYIAMEFIEGRPLSELARGQRLAPETVVRYGTQIAEALAHAHERGLVHRDLKSGNVMVTSEGRVKVLDFGLAKRLRGEELEEVTRSQESLTEPGAQVGTLAYMAPEQLRGEPADARTDVWALGCVLYEMAAGARPFQGQTSYGLSSAILQEPPRPLPGKVPVEVRAVVDRCLAKEPPRRYQRAGEVRAALEAIQTGTVSPWVRWKYALRRRQALAALAAVVVLVAAAVLLNLGGLKEKLFGVGRPKVESIAVLPLDNLSGNPEQEYFADGMTEALITELSKVSALRVISRTSVMQYKGVRKPLPEIAQELNVDAVVEGSVLRVSDRVRITAQLIHVPSDAHLWADNYDRELRDILALHSEVAQAIAQEIRVAVTPGEKTRLARARTIHPEAYEAYLKGRHHWNKRTAADLQKALTYFQQAVGADPEFALAYVGLADTYALLPMYADFPAREASPRARSAALNALEIDENLGEAYMPLAFAKYHLDWDWSAEKEFQQGLALNPNYATGHHWYAGYLSRMARHGEAIKHNKRAVALDPLSLIINSDLARHYYFARQYEQAVKQFHKAIELDPDFYDAFVHLCETYIEMGKYEQAVAECEKTAELSERNNHALEILAYAYAAAGQTEAAKTVLKELERRANNTYISPYTFAVIYTGLSREQEALRWLEKGFAEGSSRMVLTKVDPALDPLRDDPRFQALLRRMNFPSH